MEWIEGPDELSGTGESGCGCGCPSGVRLGSIGGLGSGYDPNDVTKNGYVGPAIVEAGTDVYATPEHGKWAVVPEDVELEIELAPGASWAMIRSAKGISDIAGPGCNCDAIFRAFVPRSRVRVPRQSPPPKARAPLRGR